MKDDIAFAAVIFASLATLFAVIATNSADWTTAAVGAAFGANAVVAHATSCAQQQVEAETAQRGATVTPGNAESQALARSADSNH